MKLVLAGEKDLEKGPIPEILANFPDAELMVFRPPSEVVFEEEIDRMREKISGGEVDLIAYCFPGTYVSNIQIENIGSKVLIDPPSGVEDSEGNLMELDASRSEVLASKGFGSGADRILDCGHWFSGCEEELVKEIAVLL